MNCIKKITKLTIKTAMLSIILFAVFISIILEPNIKISGWEALDEDKLSLSTEAITILDKDDNIVSNYALNHREYVPITELNQTTIDAFISIEDKRFFKHEGLDYVRLISALKTNILSHSYKEGASTISQQLIKNTHLSNEKKLARKIKEMRLAVDLERKYTKDEILQMYLNMLYFGNNIYGIGTASKLLFGTDASLLTLEQSALLAGMINNPQKFSPYYEYDNALQRRNLVLKRMYHNKKISASQYSLAITKPIEVLPLSYENWQYYNNVIKEAVEILGCTKADLYSKKLVIGTNLDTGIQNKIQSIVQNQSKNIQKQAKSSSMSDITLLQALVIDNLTGDIISVSSNCKLDLSHSRRQVGSVIKPVICYAPALENNIIVPMTPIEDTRTSFDGYSPTNYLEKYEGWTSVQNSLINSSNVCAVKILEQNGIDDAKSYAQKCGYDFSDKDTSLALALGGMHKGATLKQVTNSFLVFANDGNYIDAKTISYIKSASGEILYKRTPSIERVFSSETAFYMNDMLLSCAKDGTARLLQGNNICAKTGTVGNKDGNTDAYCIAYTPQYTLGVWIGTTNSSYRTKITGGGTPTLIAKKIFADVLGESQLNFNRPNTIIELDIDINEYYKSHKLLVASQDIKLKDRQKAYFTCKTRPTEYSFINSENSEQIFSEYDINNFEAA